MRRINWKYAGLIFIALTTAVVAAISHEIKNQNVSDLPHHSSAKTPRG
jgi:hypothetical protein